MNESKRPPGAIPVALTALAYVAPIRLPDLQLPAASEVLDCRTTSPEAWRAYEDIRSIEGRKMGAVPVVASANNLWRELRSNLSTNPAFRELVNVLEKDSFLFRLALQGLTKANSENSMDGGRR